MDVTGSLWGRMGMLATALRAVDLTLIVWCFVLFPRGITSADEPWVRVQRVGSATLLCALTIGFANNLRTPPKNPLTIVVLMLIGVGLSLWLLSVRMRRQSRRRPDGGGCE